VLEKPEQPGGEKEAQWVVDSGGRLNGRREMSLRPSLSVGVHTEMKNFNIAISEHRTSKPQLPRNSSQRLSLSTFHQSFTHCRYTIPASPKREGTPYTRPQIVSSCVTLPVSTGPGLLPRGNLQKPVEDHSVHTDRRDARTSCSSLGLDLGVQWERVKVSLLVGALLLYELGFAGL